MRLCHYTYNYIAQNSYESYSKHIYYLVLIDYSTSYNIVYDTNCIHGYAVVQNHPKSKKFRQFQSITLHLIF